MASSGYGEFYCIAQKSQNGYSEPGSVQRASRKARSVHSFLDVWSNVIGAGSNICAIDPVVRGTGFAVLIPRLLCNAVRPAEDAHSISGSDALSD